MTSRRITLWLSALPIFFLVGSFLNGFGHASSAAPAMFGSWGLLAALPLRLIQIDRWFYTVALPWLLVAQLTYWAALLWVSSSLARRNGLNFYFIAPLFHLLGGILVALVLPNGHLVTPRNTRFSYLISLSLLVVFFCVDWLLLQGELGDSRREAG